MLQSGLLNYVALGTGGSAAVAIFNNLFSMVEAIPKEIAATMQIIAGILVGENVIVRIRDDCRACNPKKWHEIYNSENLESHIGIKLVSKIAAEFNYINVLKLNNLIIKI